MGNIKGTGTFNDDSTNNGNVDIGVFGDNATNNGDVKNGAFDDNATNNGNVSDTGVFNDGAKNQGTVKNGKFSPTATNTGTVEDYSALAAPPALVNGKWTHNGVNVTGYYKVGKIVDGDVVDGDNVVAQALDFGRYKWYLPGQTTSVLADGFFSSGGYELGLKIPSGSPWYKLEPIEDMGPNYYGYYPDLNSPHAPANGPFTLGYFTGGYRDNSYNNRTPQSVIDSRIDVGRFNLPSNRYLNRHFFYVYGEPYPASGGYSNGHYHNNIITDQINVKLLQDENVIVGATAPFAFIGSQINNPPKFGTYPDGDGRNAAEPANGPYVIGYMQDGYIDENYENRTPQHILGVPNSESQTSDTAWYGIYKNSITSSKCMGIGDSAYWSNGCFGDGVGMQRIEGHILYEFEVAQRIPSDGRIHQSIWESVENPETFYYYSAVDGYPSPVEPKKTVFIPPTSISWNVDSRNETHFTYIGTANSDNNPFFDGYYIIKSPAEGTVLWSEYEYAAALNSDASYVLPEESYVQISELGDAYWFDTASRPPIAATKTYISLGDVLDVLSNEYVFAHRSEWPPTDTYLWGPAEYEAKLAS